MSWYQAFLVAHEVQNVPKPVILKWIIPSDGWVKIDVDGATRMKYFSGEVGAMLRDWTWKLLAAGAWRN